MGKSTLLLDFDLQFGDMAELAGVQHPLRIDEAIANPERLTGLQPQGNAPALLAASAAHRCGRGGGCAGAGAS